MDETPPRFVCAWCGWDSKFPSPQGGCPVCLAKRRELEAARGKPAPREAEAP